MTTNKNNSYTTFDQEINTFFKDRFHFSCLINTCLYQGQDIISPEELTVVDSRIQAYTRDVLMLWNGRYGSYYLGIENQLIENYPMPYRILIMTVWSIRIRWMFLKRNTEKRRI